MALDRRRFDLLKPPTVSGDVLLEPLLAVIRTPCGTAGGVSCDHRQELVRRELDEPLLIGPDLMQIDVVIAGIEVGRTRRWPRFRAVGPTHDPASPRCSYVSDLRPCAGS